MLARSFPGAVAPFFEIEEPDLDSDPSSVLSTGSSKGSGAGAAASCDPNGNLNQTNSTSGAANRSDNSGPDGAGGGDDCSGGLATASPAFRVGISALGF